VSKFSLLFLFAFAYGVYAIFFVAPVYGFYLYELIYFLNPGNRWWSQSLPNIGYSFVTVLFTLAVYFLKRNEFDKNTLSRMPEAKWFAIVFLIYCGIYFVSITPEMHQRYLFDLFKLFIIMFIAYRMLDSFKKLEIAMLLYLVGAAYIGYEAFTVGRNASGRVEGIGMVDVPEANGTAAALAPAIAILVYFFWQKPWKVKLVIAVLGLVIANGLVLINSRGAFLGAAVAGGFFFAHMMFSKYKLPRQKLMIVFLMVAGSLVIIRLADDSFWERMGTIKTSSMENTNQSGARRINFWIATFDMLEDHPLGTGIYGYQVLSPLYLDASLMDSHFRKKNMRAVHSMWFQGLAEIGWIGALCFLLLLRSLFAHIKSAKKRLIELGDYRHYYMLVALQGGLLGYMVAGSFINAFRTEIFYWMMMFCIAASTIALRIYEKSDEVAETSPTRPKNTGMIQ